jgi:glycosyltransferase involved in cell wall biosynthesis
MLLQMLAALPDSAQAEVWLPTDLRHGCTPLCVELDRLGIANRHLDLPVLRRAYRTPRSLVALVRRCGQLRSEFRRAKPALVYCTTSAALLAAPIARRSGVPKVVGHLQEIWTDGDRRVLGRLARSCQTLIAISAAVADATGPQLRPRTVVVHNATSDPGHEISPSERTGPVTYVVASRWTPRKGLGTLLTAWDRATDPGRLIILGGPPGSGEGVDVRAIVATLRRPESVTVVGEVADPAKYIDAADAVLVPSDQPEGFGLVAIEGFARHRAAIVSATGGLPEVIRDGVDGWLFPPGDADALASLLSRLDRATLVAAGKQARASYEANFSTASYGRRWSRAAGFSSLDELAVRHDRR